MSLAEHWRDDTRPGDRRSTPKSTATCEPTIPISSNPLQQSSAPARFLAPLAVVFLVFAAACASDEKKKEPYTPPDPDKPLPLGTYINKLDGLLQQWNKAMLLPETTKNRALRTGLQLELAKRVKARFDELRQQLETSNVERNRVIVAAALGFVREPRALNPLLNALNDPSPSVREHALIGLAELADPNTPVDIVALKLEGESSDAEQVNATLCLYRLAQEGIDVTKALPALRHGLDSRNPAVRVQSAAALGDAHDHESTPQLLAILHDDRQLAAAAAANALGKIGDTKTVPQLIEALSAPDYAVRDEARGALKRMNNGEDLGSEPGPWLRWKEKLDIGRTNDPTSTAPSKGK